MVVNTYWKERLEQGRFFYADEFFQEPYIRGQDEDGWPRAVSRSAMFEDYIYWFQDSYLDRMRQVPYYRDNLERLPKASDQLTFYSTMSPWIYVVGKKEQVRSYHVTTSEFYDGNWIKVKANRYFIRLCSREVHMAAFALNTDIWLNMPHAYMSTDDLVRIVEDARDVYYQRLKDNRYMLPSSMQKDPLTV